jgi:hypothetical protein
MASELELSRSELARALSLWEKTAQAGAFAEEIGMLEKLTPNGEGTKNLRMKQCDLFLDRGFIRMGGRMRNSRNLSEDAKFPILLPKRSRITNMIIDEKHRQMNHVGGKTLLGTVRNRYWILGGQRTIDIVVRRCLPCRKSEGQPFRPPKLGSLPAQRVTQSLPFTHVGLDCLGPMMVRMPYAQKSEKKFWILLFTCFSCRALHLEVLEDLSGDAVVFAVMRFIARRGKPQSFLSDNGTNFKKADRILQALWGDREQGEWRQTLSCYFAKIGIDWKYIPEGSPWMGGFYERLVGLTKTAMRRAIWGRRLSLVQFTTLVAKIEGIVNTRPIVQASRVKDGLALAPINIISPGADMNVVCPPLEEDLEETDYQPSPGAQGDILRLHRRVESALVAFWKVWKRDYLKELMVKQAVLFPAVKGEVDRSPAVGEVVLVKAAGARATWCVARVEKLSMGKDGEVRVATLRYSSGHQNQRGIKDLIPLELEFQSEDMEGVILMRDKKLEQIQRLEDSAALNVSLFESEKENLAPGGHGLEKRIQRLEDTAPLEKFKFRKPAETEDNRQVRGTSGLQEKEKLLLVPSTSLFTGRGRLSKVNSSVKKPVGDTKPSLEGRDKLEN